ncbi:MAG TPA: CopG family transcriptional regulator [Ktedonobacteraceae bacterium]|nr:CopG family transcriptional regulator [Ktedonobacteraceae bacterium]
MKRTNLYPTEQQMERLHQRAEQEGVAIAELVRRAVDSFLAWDDPTYAPVPKPQIRTRHSSPASKTGAISARSL